MVSPPHEGDASYPLFLKEKTAILSDLREKATIIGEGLNKIPGMSVNIPDGAMYAFVKFDLPQKFIQENKDNDVNLDEIYCLALLEETGICVVPGSGFGQLPDTLHFRVTFLPSRDQVAELIEKLKAFHIRFISTNS